jgi:hypothetical protein
MTHIIRKIVFIAFLFAICATVAFSQTRVTSFGSNPDLSYSLFPQDLAKTRANTIAAFSSYCKSPWWGDIDQFDNKPNGTYTITGNQVIKSTAFFQESAKMQTTQNLVGYSYRPSDNFSLLLDGNFAVNFLSDIANGNFTYDNNGTREGYVPFDYTLRHTLYDAKLRGITGFRIGDIPFGAMLILGKENTLSLHKELNVTKGEDEIRSSERALWGWAKVGCNHIFGVRGTEGDAWFQDNYSMGPLYKLNFRAGADLEKIKAGISVYAKAGSQDYYSWQENTTDSSLLTSDTLLNERFVGNYVKGDWQKKSHESVISAYGNIHWLTQERFGIHSFVSLSYNGDKEGNALSGNDDVESDRKETIRGFALEFDPNINIKLGQELHYIDIALLSRFNYNRYNNTMMAWVNGGRTKTYWDGSMPDEEEDVWEQFSYANQNLFDIGLDISTMFPILNNNFGDLGFGFILYGSSRLNLQTKYYGSNTAAGAENVFTVNAERHNFAREIKFNTSLLFDYTFNPLRIRLEVTEPVLHNLLQRTKIKTGDQETYNHRKDPLWLSQQGLQLGLFVTYNFQFSFLPYQNTAY